MKIKLVYAFIVSGIAINTYAPPVRVVRRIYPSSQPIRLVRTLPAQRVIIPPIHRVVRISRATPVMRRKILIAHRLINPANKISIGHLVHPRKIITNIHLPVRANHLFSRMQVKTNYFRNFFNNAFDSQIDYAGDKLTVSVRNGQNLTITCRDYTGRIHKITTRLPQPVKNLVGKIQVTNNGNTVSLVMPRI